jgi:transketolase
VRSKKPTLIACRTSGTGSPGGLAVLAGAEARAQFDWDDPPFVIPDDLRGRWHAAGSRGAVARRSWLKRLARHNQRGEFERVMAGRLPDAWHESVAALKQDLADSRPMQSSQSLSQTCLDALVPAMPELIGGAARTSGPAAPKGRRVATISPGNHGGRYLLFGVRDHGMAAAANGMALHGGIVPHVSTRFVASDSLRPALRMSAMMGQRIIYLLTHDSIGLGGDGPALQPVEHLASLRAIPNVHVFRPADAIETAECWELAIRRSEGPSVLVLSRQALPALRTDWVENRCARGGYVLAEADGPRQATVVATGSEVAIAMMARERLAADGIAIGVVSLPCWELFGRQDDAYRAQVLGGAPRIGLECAGGFGWDAWLGRDDAFIGMTGFGTSASCAALYAHFGITAEAVVAAVTRRLG